MRLLPLLVAAVTGCSSPAPHPAAPAPAPTPRPQPAPTAPTQPDQAEVEPPFEWTACLFAKQDLVAHKHGAVKIVPDGGFLLVIAHIESDEENSHAFIGWLALGGMPGAKDMKIEGMMEDKRSEFGHTAGVETSYEIHGTATSAKGSTIELALESTQQPHMFDPDSPLHRIVVAAERFEDPAKCVFEPQKR